MNNIQFAAQTANILYFHFHRYRIQLPNNVWYNMAHNPTILYIPTAEFSDFH